MRDAKGRKVRSLVPLRAQAPIQGELTTAAGFCLGMSLVDLYDLKIEHKKKEGVLDSLLLRGFRGWLEVEPDCELQLSHCGATFKSRNLTVVATLAIDTCLRPVVRTESINRMVEYVEGIHAELRVKSLFDGELLHDRQVRIESRRAMECVSPEVTDCAAGVRDKRPRRRPC